MTTPLIPLEHFFDNPQRALAKVSPDRKWMSWLAPREGRMNVWVRPFDASDADAVPVTNDRDRGVLGYFWTRDSSAILYSKDGGGDEIHHLLAVDPASPDAEPRDLTPYEGVKAGVIALPRSTPKTMLVSLNLRDRSLSDAYRLDIATGAITLLAENPGNIQGWLADREGRVRAAIAQTPAGDSELLVRDREDDPFRVLAEFTNEDGGSPFAFSADNREIYVSSAKESDLARLVAIEVATGTERVIDEDAEADLAGPVISDMTGALLAASYVRDRLLVHCFDDEFARHIARMGEVHSGDPSVLSRDREEAIWTVYFDDDRDPGATYLYEAATGEASLLYRPRPWLNSEHLAPMEPVRITSRDGLTLSSYLTVPLGVERSALPMVLVVHGGPWARDAWGYDAEAQFLANRGYAVLQVNYRGSTGFGKAFTHAAEREFAGKMHDDLIDAVDWAIAEGIADPARIGIYGGSYGGYATLVGVTFTPDVFAAAVSFVGPSNLVSLIRSFPEYWRPFLESSWYRFVGDPDNPASHDDLVARSPITHVDRIRTPLMVIQGANDPRVTQQESDQIVQALRDRGVPVEYILKEGEGHGFAKPENRLEMYGAMERFFAKYLGGRTTGEVEPTA